MGRTEPELLRAPFLVVGARFYSETPDRAKDTTSYPFQPHQRLGPGAAIQGSNHQLTPDRRQINRKSAQKHRMRRREEHDNLSKDMVEKDARIAQLEKELAVEKSKTAQLQQFIDMQRGGGGGRKRSGGRTKEDDVEMDD